MMKKYTNKHLESVPPEFIAACETAVKMLRNRKTSADTCPSVIINAEYEYVCDDPFFLCPKYIKYNLPKDRVPCPCYEFGEEKCAKLLNNLITQWKKWCGLED
jgi:hypothetical protein